MKGGCTERRRKRTLVFLAFFTLVPLPGDSATRPAVRKITPHGSVVQGPVNGVLVERGGKLLAIYGDPRENPPKVERVLFTHHRRDVVWAGRTLVERGAQAIVPAQEKQFFTDVTQFWDRFRIGRFHDYAQQTSKVLTQPIKEVKTVRGGDRIDWQGLGVEVLDTPGYTRGAVSYLVELDGKRIACVGDLIYGDGRILDLYSLQDAIPEAKEDAYHGYAARAADVIASLRKVAGWKPDLLIAARGPLIDNPREAIESLIGRLQAVFASHFAIDALRWYRGDQSLRLQASRVLGDASVNWMPLAETVQQRLPDWIVPISNSRLIVSASGAAFLVDCGSRRIMQEVRRLRQEGRFKALDGIYITHYHDDHTDQVQALAEEFRCPVFACPEMRDILEHPDAYRMPAQTSNPIRSVVPAEEGSKRRWNEFEFTYFYFPGQTLYHGGLLVKKDGGETIFFIGDSFTPSGIDDYCLLNRNFVSPEKGFLDCLKVLKTMSPGCLLINQHVLPAFRFSARQIDLMTENFARRAEAFRALFPWDAANYGLDEQWARFYPYGIEGKAGQRLELKLAILNHSPVRREYRITPRVPAGWRVPRRQLTISIPPREERFVPVAITPPPEQRGLTVVTADIAFGSWELREWAEAMVVVK